MSPFSSRREPLRTCDRDSSASSVHPPRKVDVLPFTHAAGRSNPSVRHKSSDWKDKRASSGTSDHADAERTLLKPELRPKQQVTERRFEHVISSRKSRPEPVLVACIVEAAVAASVQPRFNLFHPTEGVVCAGFLACICCSDLTGLNTDVVCKRTSEIQTERDVCDKKHLNVTEGTLPDRKVMECGDARHEAEKSASNLLKSASNLR